MGDFNAGVGTRSRDIAPGNTQHVDSLASDLTLGDFGLPELNDNGRLLLDFCRSRRGQSLRVMDTFYQHKVYGTWQHNRTKKWHHIDHIVTSANTAKLVTDVRVMPGLDFDTDHRLMRLDLQVTRVCKQPWGRHRCQTAGHLRRIPNLDLTKLKDPDTVADLNSRFADIVGEGLTDEYELWSHGLRRCAETSLGFVKANQRPQWQLDNQAALAALSCKKQEAFRRRNSGASAFQEYKEVCKDNRKQVRRILNTWWATQAEEIQQAVNRKDPNHQYQGFKQLRRVFHHGRRPPAKVRNRQGVLLSSRPERLARWKEHFHDLLNVSASVNADITGLTAVTENADLQKLPVFAEILAAVSSLKHNKATGPDGISAEILQSLSHAALRSIHEHICQVWQGVVPAPAEWKASYLVPLPKKGDLTKCEKWRGILLTAVPGKVFAKIINGRLVRHFEQNQILLETQCGFRAGRGTADMIFTLRMALEVARAKHVPLYALFVDLMKAYDSVSRAGMWQIMQRKGVPDHLVFLVQQFCEGKQAQVFAEGVLSEAFELTAGLGQGCFMEGWEQLSPDKLQFHYRLDGILRRHMDEGSLNKYATWESLLLHELGYADDAAFLADTYDKLVVLSLNLQRHYSNWGLTMSVEKTEILLTEGPNPDPIQVQEVDGCDRLHFCSDFKYLGSKIERRPGCLGDITYRLDKARKAFWSLTKHIWDVKQISLQVKLQVYRACVLSVLLYGAESWTTTFSCRKKMETFHMKCLRKICKVTIWDQENWHMNNLVLRQFLGVPTIKQLVTQARLRWFGHLARMPSERLPKQMLFAFLPGDVGTPTQAGRRSGKWLSYEQVSDLESVNIPLHAWMHIARKNQGSGWREIVYKAAPWFTPLQPHLLHGGFPRMATRRRRCRETQFKESQRIFLFM